MAAVAKMTWTAATLELPRLDPAFSPVVERAGPPRMRTKDPDGHFGALVRAIAYQQLAGKAAAAIHGRFRALIPGTLTPEAVLALPEDAMRGAGLSAAKTASIRDLAARAAGGELALAGLPRLTDDEIVARLSAVRGIGRWTAEMFLLFELQRPDVWPVDDLGVRHGWRMIHGQDELIPPKALLAEGERFRPHRSTVALLCYHAVHVSRGTTPAP